MNLKQALDELNITDNKVSNQLLEKYSEEIYNELIIYFIKNEIEITYDNIKDIEIDTTDIVKLHFIDVERVDLKSNAEHKLLFMMLANTEITAEKAKFRTELIECNMRLVLSVAKHYHIKYGYPFLDAAGDGYLGLIKAVDNFDYTRGYTFSTFATLLVRQAIKKYSDQKSSTIRLSPNKIKELTELRRTLSNLENIFGREPTAEEVAMRLNISLEKINKLFKELQLQSTASLDRKINDDSDLSLGDLIADENAFTSTSEIDKSSLKIAIKDVLDSLTAQEKNVIERRFGLNGYSVETLEKIGADYNVCGERIRQIEAKALRKLRHPSRSNTLADYLND